MSITNTSNFKLRQITYLHDGQESADAFNETMTILDGLFNYLISWRATDDDDNVPAVEKWGLGGDLVVDRITGEPVLNRLSLPF